MQPLIIPLFTVIIRHLGEGGHPLFGRAHGHIHLPQIKKIKNFNFKNFSSPSVEHFRGTFIEKRAKSHENTSVHSM